MPEKSPSEEASELASFHRSSHHGASQLEGASFSYSMLKKFVVVALVFGAIGGVGGGLLIAKYGNISSSSVVSHQQVVLQDSSAVISVIKNVSPSVVSISSSSTVAGLFGLSTSQESAGTGIIVSSDGLIMTNNHVVDGQSSLTVTTSDGKVYSNATVVATDATRDIAFIRVKASGLKTATLGESNNLQVGTRVVAIGNALGQFQNSATEGIISGLGRDIQAGDQSSTASSESLSNLIQTDAAINPGNSGGPLVDISGNVIGMDTAISSQAQNIGFAIPVDELKSALSSVQSKGTIAHPYLGVRYITITPDFAANNNITTQNGAYITGDINNLAVLPGSPAANAGLEEGDIITKVNSDTLDQNNDLSGLISKYNVGDKLTITYIRSGKTLTTTVTLQQAPSGQ
ncbi:MAG: S1C family serine protease [Candidatus Saccharimonadia bacterium]